MTEAVEANNQAATMAVKGNGDVVVDANGTEVVIHSDGTTNLTPANNAAAAQVALVLGQQTAEGVFIGQYAPKDRDGISLGKIFNVFAAPQDLGGRETYVDTVKHISQLKNWNGFDGTNYATDKELYKAIKDGSYNGGWIIPTRDVLTGKDVDGNNTQSGNLLDAFKKGALKDVKTSSGSGSYCPDWYWSSTEGRDCPSFVHDVRLSDGYESWDPKDGGRLSVRPVRLVPVS